VFMIPDIQPEALLAAHNPKMEQKMDQFEYIVIRYNATTHKTEVELKEHAEDHVVTLPPMRGSTEQARVLLQACYEIELNFNDCKSSVDDHLTHYVWN